MPQDARFSVEASLRLWGLLMYHISTSILESTNGMSSGTVKLTTWADNMGRPTLDSIQPLMLSLAALESDRY